MTTSIRKREPIPSLDELLDQLIHSPSDIDKKLVGMVEAQKPKTTRSLKGKSELIELNEWIDSHNRLPDANSDDFKESRLARRMNGYAGHSKEHEDLKPFDKYDLIKADLYQKPAPRACASSPYEAPTVVSDDSKDVLEPTEIKSEYVNSDQPIAEKKSASETAPVSAIDNPATPQTAAPSVAEAAKAIFELRESKSQAPVESIENATPSSLTSAPLDGSFGNNEDLPTLSAESSEFETVADTTRDATSPAVSVLNNIVGLEAAHPDTDLLAIDVPVGEPSLPYLDILYNPPLPAISYFDITYVSKYTPFAFGSDSLEDTATLEPTPHDSDDVLQMVASVPSHERLPDDYQDEDTVGDDLLPISKDKADVEADTYLCIGEDGSETDDSHDHLPAPSKTTEPAKTTHTAGKPTVSTPAVEHYWSIDGDYDLDIVNSDYATGLTQRHNPEPPMTAADKARADAAATKLVQDQSSTAASPSTALAQKEEIAPTVSKASPSSRTAKSRRQASDDNKERKANRGVVDDDPIMTSLDYFLAETVVTSKQPAEEFSGSQIETFDSLEDILASDADFIQSLSADEDKYFDTDNQYGATTSVKSTPDEIGKQTPCADFYMYENHFKILHDRLASGDLKTIKYTATNLKQGDAFILDGIVGFVQKVGAERSSSNGKFNPRLRLVFDNKTESNILLNSLNKRLYADPNGRRIVRSADEFTDFDFPESQARVKTGQVYIVRTLSEDPALNKIPNLYKIGFTSGTVQERTKNAVNDMAFLESPIEIVEVANCYNLDPRGLEGVIHGFLHAQRINITLTSKKGGSYQPKEWFSIDLDEAKKVIGLIIDGSIIDYRMDNTTNRVVAK